MNLVMQCRADVAAEIGRHLSEKCGRGFYSLNYDLSLLSPLKRLTSDLMWVDFNQGLNMGRLLW